MPNNTIRAARFHAYGGPEELVLEPVARPEPQAGEVLVGVRAAGVNPVDWKLRQGYLKDFWPLTLPHTSGLDLAGIVEAVGPGVSAFQPGQEVYGQGTGTYAEYAIAPATALALKPRNVTFDEAAAIPLGVFTAWAAIFETAGLQAGQRILVHGAAGGVGQAAVQLARWKGAHVIGTASAGNVDFVRSLGAGTVVDYNATPFETVVQDVDVVLDTIGGDTLELSWQVLKPGGILVTVVGMASEDTAKKHGVRTGSVSARGSTELLQQVAALVESGAVVPVVGKVFPLEEARQAQMFSATGHGRGRIVLHVAD